MVNIVSKIAGIIIGTVFGKAAVKLLTGNFATGELIIVIVNRCHLTTFGDGLFHVVQRIVASEVILHIFCLCIDLLGRSHIEVVGIVHVFILVNGKVCGEVNVNFAFFCGVFGGDDNDAVGGAGTVNCGCSCVFEDVN